MMTVRELGIFDRFRRKEEKKQALFSNPSAVVKAERNAMAKEDLKEAIRSLGQIYSQCKGPQFALLSNYYAGKLDGCGIVENHLKGEESYTLVYLENYIKNDKTRVGDDFNRGRWEFLSWALSQLHYR
jgi:hypothetical protein